MRCCHCESGSSVQALTVSSVKTRRGLPEADGNRASGKSSIPVHFFRRAPLIIVMSLVFLHLAAGAAQVEPSSELTISTESQKIALSVCGQPLWRVLKGIEKESGVVFGVEGHIRNEIVCVNLRGENWRQLLDQLLQEYNKALVHRDDGSLQRVLILNHKNPGSPISPEVRLPTLADAPQTVPSPLLESAVADATHPQPSWPGVPPVVPGPPDSTAEDSDGTAGDSVFLRGLIPPPDMDELPSPPEDGLLQSDGTSRSSPKQ